MEIFRAQRDTRIQSLVLTPLKAMDEVLEQEYKKGEIHSFELAVALVDLRLDDLNQQIKILTKEIENASASSTPPSDPLDGPGAWDERLDLSPEFDPDGLGT